MHKAHPHCCGCRTDSSGLDMNRLWNSASPEMEPALHSMLQQLQLYEDDPAHSLDMFVDLHGHSASRSHFLFCNPPTEGAALGPEAQERLTRQGAGLHWVHLHLCLLGAVSAVMQEQLTRQAALTCPETDFQNMQAWISELLVVLGLGAQAPDQASAVLHSISWGASLSIQELAELPVCT